MIFKCLNRSNHVDSVDDEGINTPFTVACYPAFFNQKDCCHCQKNKT